MQNMRSNTLHKVIFACSIICSMLGRARFYPITPSTITIVLQPTRDSTSTILHSDSNDLKQTIIQSKSILNKSIHSLSGVNDTGYLTKSSNDTVSGQNATELTGENGNTTGIHNHVTDMFQSKEMSRNTLPIEDIHDVITTQEDNVIPSCKHASSSAQFISQANSIIENTERPFCELLQANRIHLPHGTCNFSRPTEFHTCNAVTLLQDMEEYLRKVTFYACYMEHYSTLYETSPSLVNSTCCPQSQVNDNIAQQFKNLYIQVFRIRSDIQVDNIDKPEIGACPENLSLPEMARHMFEGLRRTKSILKLLSVEIEVGVCFD